MPKIKIRSMPDGFAPANIRDQWVGVEIPLMTFNTIEEEKKVRAQFPPGPNTGGWLVRREDAVAALQAAGREQAAAFWDNFYPLGPVLMFHTSVADIID